MNVNIKSGTLNAPYLILKNKQYYLNINKSCAVFYPKGKKAQIKYIKIKKYQ